MREFETGAVRDSEGTKPDWTILPLEALPRVAHHLSVNAPKYGRHNYQKGIPVSACARSAFRHLVAWIMGDKSEDHLAAAVVNLLFALYAQEVHADNPAINNDPRCGE
jgi:hypothetical protein